jgi:hypothetical protein
MMFREERNVIPNFMIPTMTTRKLMRKRCMAYLACVIDTKKDETKLS